MSEHIVVEQEQRVMTIRMQRPEKKNAISIAMYHAMTSAISMAAQTPQVRAVVITGATDCFSAGNDIADFVKSGSSGDVEKLQAPLHFLRALATLDKPLVAAVHGAAIGIGTTMLLHCDFVYANASARFRTPFVELALVPEGGSSLMLPALVGHRRAAQLLLLGETIDAQTALSWGLITGVVDDPMTAAQATATKLIALAPNALQMSKQLSQRPSREAILETISYEGVHFAARLKSPEAMEAFAAFMARRPADFSAF
jgi:enoyl-CoA hydratase/carnithine racemase